LHVFSFWERVVLIRIAMQAEIGRNAELFIVIKEFMSVYKAACES
jgi:hypothetical protein